MASPAFGGQYLLMTQTRNPLAPSWHNCFSHSSHSRPCSARSVQRSADCNFARANTQSQLPPSPATSEIFCHQKAGNFTAWEILHFDDLPSLAEPSYRCPFTDGFPIFSQLYQAISLHFSSFLWGFPSILPGSAGISPDFRLSQELGQRLTGAQQLKRQQTQQLLRHVQSEDRQTPIASMISYEKYSLKIWSIEK